MSGLPAMPGGQFAGTLDQKAIQRHQLVQKLSAAGATFYTDKGAAESKARTWGYITVSVPGIGGVRKGFESAGENVPITAVVDPARWGGSGGGGSAQRGGAGSGGVGAGAGLTNAGSHQLQGGADIPRGATSSQGVGVDVRSEFLGLSTFAPDTQIGPQHASYAENVDGISARGALTKRPGMVPLYPNKDTIFNATAQLRVPAKANFAANTDYFLFTTDGGTTHAFWFDTTGADSEPAGSVAADDSDRVDISGATTPTQVATLFVAAITAAAIGLTPTLGSAGTGYHDLTAAFPGDDGNDWSVAEFVTHALGIVVSNFSGGQDAISAGKKGRSINALPEGFRNAGRAMLVLGYDGSSLLGEGVVTSGETELRAIAVDTTYNAQRDITRVKPVISPLSNTGGTVTFRVLMPTPFRHETGNNEGVLASVDQLVVVASKGGYCLDRDILDKLEGVRVVENYTDWDGNTLGVVDAALTLADIWYYTVWAVKKREVSLPSFFYAQVAV